MVPQSSLADIHRLVVLDASVVINLNASNFAREILGALPNRVVVVKPVAQELEGGRLKGRLDADHLENLVSAKLIDIEELDEDELQIYEDLVCGSTASTLDDGEAATIACALRRNGMAVIDEKKANKICRERFPGLLMGCSIGIFSHPMVRNSLGEKTVRIALSNALHDARMGVPKEHLEWVATMVGAKNIRQFSSLPALIRS